MQVAFGSGLWYATGLTDAYGNAISNPTPVLLGIMQDCSVDLSFDTKELHGQNQFPVDIARGKGKIAAKAKSASINAAQFNTLFFGQTVNTGLISIYHDITGAAIPATPFTITAAPPSSGVFAADLGVRDQFGVPFIRVAASPTTGQYAVNAGTGVYTFAAADTGKTVFTDYRYTVSATGKQIVVPNLPMGEIPTFQSELLLKKNGKSTYVRLPNCVTSKLSMQTKQDDYTIPDFDMMGFADSLGNCYYLSSVE
jgi:hypothetical protein